MCQPEKELAPKKARAPAVVASTCACWRWRWSGAAGPATDWSLADWEGGSAPLVQNWNCSVSVPVHRRFLFLRSF